MNHRRDEQRHGSSRRILIAGTGGQGVLTAARLLCDFFTTADHSVVSGQLHGMAQRGGSVRASVMIDCGISPRMAEGRADFLLGFEPVETVRALPFLSSSTIVYMNTSIVVPFTLGQQAIAKDADGRYPDLEGLIASVRAVTPSVLSIDATRIARDAGSAGALNMVMLGCLAASGALLSTVEDFWNAVATRLPAQLAEVNARAYSAGVEVGRALPMPEGRSCA